MKNPLLVLEGLVERHTANLSIENVQKLKSAFDEAQELIEELKGAKIHGAMFILDERFQHLSKHGRTIENDVKYNTRHELVQAATELMKLKPRFEAFPSEWDSQIVWNMIEQPYKKRLIIAGSLVAAEFDRVEAAGE